MSDSRINFIASTLNAETVAAFIECQGMIAENKEREIKGQSLAYGENSFIELSNDIRSKMDRALNHYHNL